MQENVAAPRGPGPNDFHVDKGGRLIPGLGPDEPSDDKKAGARAAAEARLHALKKDVEAEAAKLDQREQTLAEREEALARREAKLAIAEKKGGRNKSPTGSASEPADDDTDKDED